MPAVGLSGAQLLPVHAPAAGVRDGHCGGEVHCGARQARPQQQGAPGRARCSTDTPSGLGTTRLLAAPAAALAPCLDGLSLSSLPFAPSLTACAASMSHQNLGQIGHALQAAFFEELCQDINPEEKTIVACFPPGTGMDESCFKIPYDVLVIGEVYGL